MTTRSIIKPIIKSIIKPIIKNGGARSWNITDLFQDGVFSAWYPTDPSLLWLDTAGTTPITSDGGIALMQNPGGLTATATQATEALRPVYRSNISAREYGSSRFVAGTDVAGTTGNTLAVHCTWSSNNGLEAVAGIAGFFIAKRQTTGFLAASVGSQASSAIIGNVNVLNETGVAVLTEDNTTVKLYWNGREVYSGAKVGSVATDRGFYEGTFNSNNTPASNYFLGKVYNRFNTHRAITAEEVQLLTNYWLNVPETLLPFTLTDYGFTFSGTDQHRNGGLAANGKSVMVKRSASVFTIINTDGTAYQDDLDLPTGFNTSGAILGANNKLYSPPRDSEFAVVIDMETETATTTNFGLSLVGNNKWTDGVLGDDGKIYCVPSSASDILIIDTNTSTATATRSNMGATFSPASLNGEDMQWIDGIKAPDGRIFCIPYSATSVLIIDPAAGTASLNNFGLTFGGSGTQNWTRGAMGVDGKIYCAPRWADSVLIIDPSNDTAEMKNFGLDLSAPDKYACAYSLRDGKIYMPPSLQRNVLVIDPIKQTASQVPMTDLYDLTQSNFYIGGVIGPDGKLRCPPRSTSKFLIIG